MKAVIQRVSSAKVVVNKVVIGQISEGLLVFIGIAQNDQISQALKLADKVCNLRIFNDTNNKINLNLQDINGSLLIISQFTLYANCKKGNRPSFVDAASPVHAKKIYNEFVNYMEQKKINVHSGEFGANMSVSLINSGPATFILDT